MTKIARGQVWQHKETGTLIVVEGFPDVNNRPDTCVIRIGDNQHDFWSCSLWIVDQQVIKKAHVYIGEL